MKKLVVIGASYLQVPLIVRAREMGYETHTFAWKQGAVGAMHSDRFYPISITETHEILKNCRQIEPEGIVTIGSDLAGIAANDLSHRLGLIANSQTTSRVATNKYEMRKALIRASLPCPAFLQVTSPDESMTIQEQLALPVIVKPQDRSGSRGVTRVDHAGQLEPAIKRALTESFCKRAVAEQFLTGREVSVEMISWQGKHFFLNTTDKVTTGSPYFVEIQHHQPADLSPDLRERIVALTKQGLTALNIRYGASHTELLITPDQSIYFIEVAARMAGDHIGAELVRHSTGYDFVKGVIDVATGRFEPVRKRVDGYAGIYFVTPRAGTVRRIDNRPAGVPEIVKSEILVNIGDKVKYPVMQSNERAAFFIYKKNRGRLDLDPNRIIRVETYDTV